MAPAASRPDHCPPTSILGQEATVTDGLVLLAAWAIFGAMVAVLVWFVLRGTRR